VFKKKNILLIGLGNIGRWHLISLLNLDGIANVFCVENNISRLNLINRSIKNKTKTIFFSNDLPKKINKIDLLIMATKSHNRHLLFKKIKKKYFIKNIIFEKIITNNLENFKSLVQNLTIAQQRRSYVNCPRRLWPGYQLLKKKISINKKTKMVVSGYNWNMSSNLIHVLDIFCYLTNTKKIKILELKPEKYFILKNYELKYFGKLILKTPKGTLEIEDKFSSDSNLKTFNILLENQKNSFHIIENKKRLLTLHNNKNKNNYYFGTLNQSAMTANISNHIINGRKIKLSTLSESKIHHKIVFEIFKKILSYFKIKKNNLYIT
jgi:hypothetical protein